MSFPEIKAALLRSTFPSLQANHDPDIENYYELRATGRLSEALSLYASRLKPRYPDDDFRTCLLRLYRLRSPVYQQLQAKAYADLGHRLLEGLKQRLKIIADKANNFDPQDLYSTIRTAESILIFLPKERFSAIATIERYHYFAQSLDCHQAGLAMAENLVRAYLTDSLELVASERLRRKNLQDKAEQQRKRALIIQDRLALKNAEQRKRNKDRAAKKADRLWRSQAQAKKLQFTIDFSNIHFSKDDVSRILIPVSLTKIEDKTLAYCYKYWNLVTDSAFERVIYLYSKKNQSCHYKIFSIIKHGRRSKKSDDEILTMVLTNLVSGYYYSIRGDLYLKRHWTILRNRFEAAKASLPSSEVQTLVQKPAVVPAQRSIKTAAKATSWKALRPTKPASQPTLPRKARPAVQPSDRTTVPKRSKVEAAHSGSVADKLRKLSGRSYDVYKDRFFSKVRLSIRRILADSRNGYHGLFSSIPQEAEECVYNYLFAHYEDPFMDWQNSPERSSMKGLGFDLESLDSVISDCYYRL